MRDKSAGYALIELVASLVILALISSLMLSGVVAGRRVWERLDANNVMGDSIAGAQTALRQRLERVFPVTRYDASPPYADFEGDANGVSFFAQPRDSQRPSAIRHYHIALGTDGSLTLSSTNSIASDATAPGENQVLLRGVQSMDVGYFGPGPDGAPGWQLRWKEQSAPPQLIRVRVQFAPGDGRQWPDLLIKPAVTVDTLCILNTATGRCRGRA
jgi:general secretion pathway protein J